MASRTPSAFSSPSTRAVAARCPPSATLSVISSVIAAGTTPVVRSTVAHVVHELVVGKLHRRDVDADRRAAGVGNCAMPASSAWRQACSSTQRPIGTIRPLSSAIGDEPAGRDQAARRVIPAHQRLDADDPPTRQRDGGLVVAARARSGRWRRRSSISISRRSATAAAHARVEDLDSVRRHGPSRGTSPRRRRGSVRRRRRRRPRHARCPRLTRIVTGPPRTGSARGASRGCAARPASRRRCR